MIHHAKRDVHAAHDERLTCTRYGCNWPTLPEGDDGKCDWCRKADERVEAMRITFAGDER
jgi:hypothetical protein